MPKDGLAIALPCDEYFDDHCFEDSRSAIGAYMRTHFSESERKKLGKLLLRECENRFGPGKETTRSNGEFAISFGTGRCVLIKSPLEHRTPIASVSTTTERQAEGPAARISSLFAGMQELGQLVTESKIDEVAMPLLASGRARIYPPLALVGLLLAVAEAARFAKGARRVTIIVFKSDKGSPPVIDSAVIRRALGIVGARS